MNRNGSENMKFKKIFLTTLLLLVVLTISSVCATDNLTDDGILQEDSLDVLEITDDVNYDVISSSEDEILQTDVGTFTELQNMIDDVPSGYIITLEKDYVYDEGFDTNGITINKDLTINGNGHTINGLSKSRIFNTGVVKSSLSTLNLNNIKFSNGYADYGGAIYSDAYYYEKGEKSGYNEWDIAIYNCNFENNKATSSGGAIRGNYLRIYDSNFTSNTADSNGGAIWARQFSSFTNCNFYNNRAVNMGGAIYLSSPGDDRFYQIFNCIFTSNKATNGGGGAVWCDAELDISFGDFISNNCGENGGAVYSSGGNFYIANAQFSKNQASKNGGAIYYSGYRSSEGESTVYDNLIEESSFTDNIAGEYGGAIYGVAGTYSETQYCAYAKNCTFINNKAANGNDVYGTTTTDCVFKTSSGGSSSSPSGHSKTTPKLIAKAKTFKVKTKTKKFAVTLKTNKNKVMKNFKLTLKVKGKTYIAKTNSKGKATFKITKLKKKGTFKATITYKGNRNFNKVTKIVKIIVK